MGSSRGKLSRCVSAWHATIGLGSKSTSRGSHICYTAAVNPVRKLTAAQYLTEVPDAPKGEYVMIQFNTSFANKKSVVETVTPMLDKDGKWRVIVYFIK